MHKHELIFQLSNLEYLHMYLLQMMFFLYLFLLLSIVTSITESDLFNFSIFSQSVPTNSIFVMPYTSFSCDFLISDFTSSFTYIEFSLLYTYPNPEIKIINNTLINSLC